MKKQVYKEHPPTAETYDGSDFKGKTLTLGLNNRGHGFAAQYAPLCDEVLKRCVEATDRAWRTWGVSEGNYFNVPLGYGDPPETKGCKPFARYSEMPSPVTKRPDGAIPLSEADGKTRTIAIRDAKADKEATLESAITVYPSKLGQLLINTQPGKNNYRAFFDNMKVSQGTK